MYKVIEYFTDLQDGNYEYKVGDTYPREGYEPTQNRIQQLAGGENVRKRPVIQAVAKTPDMSETSVETAENSDISDNAEDVSETEIKPKRNRKKAETADG